MNPSSDFALRVLQADPAKQAEIDRILKGVISPPATAPRAGPLLLRMKEAAKLLNCSRPTLWRICRSGRLKRIEILPNSFRLRYDDVMALAGYRAKEEDKEFLPVNEGRRM